MARRTGRKTIYYNKERSTLYGLLQKIDSCRCAEKNDFKHVLNTNLMHYGIGCITHLLLKVTLLPFLKRVVPRLHVMVLGTDTGHLHTRTQTNLHCCREDINVHEKITGAGSSQIIIRSSVGCHQSVHMCVCAASKIEAGKRGREHIK